MLIHDTYEREVNGANFILGSRDLGEDQGAPLCAPGIRYFRVVDEMRDGQSWFRFSRVSELL